jgi:hypothetical protein
MKHLIVIFFSLLSISMAGQTIKKEEVIGKWKAISLEATGKIDPTEFKELKKMFSDATFTFDKNGNAIIDLPNDEMGTSEMFRNAKWIFDENKSNIKIGSKADNYTIMGLRVVKERDKTYLELFEPSVRLLVAKQ